MKSNFSFFGIFEDVKRYKLIFRCSDVHAWRFNEHPIAIGKPFLIITRCFIVFILGVTRVFLMIYDIILIHQEVIFFWGVVRCLFLFLNNIHKLPLLENKSLHRCDCNEVTIFPNRFRYKIKQKIYQLQCMKWQIDSLHLQWKMNYV